MRASLISLLFVCFLVLAFTGSGLAASSGPSLYFTSHHNAAPLSSTYQLSSTPVGNDTLQVPPLDDPTVVELHEGAGSTWADPTALGASIPVGGKTFSIDLYVAKFGDSIRVDLEYFPSGGSAPVDLGNASFVAKAAPRTAVAEATAATSVSDPTNLTSIGHVSGSFTLGPGASFPKGAFVAIVLTSAEGNDLLTAPSLLGAPAGAQASVPLPELPSWILTAVGFAGLLGVALARRSVVP